jgi:hypothetical protein
MHKYATGNLKALFLNLFVYKTFLPRPARHLAGLFYPLMNLSGFGFFKVSDFYVARFVTQFRRLIQLATV